ncbi:MAG TPA: hypothetical protein VL400_24605 [Polyangiaceae bacterium]|nr:hypothetical protein [Polyangiaceae bacterium]
MADDDAPEVESEADQHDAEEDEPRAPAEVAAEAVPEASAETTAERSAQPTAEAEVAPAPTDPLAPVPTSALDKKGRYLRALAIAFTIYHFGGVLVGGALPNVRRVFSPIFGFYADGLKMTNSWGMFGRPPNNDNVILEAEKRDGTRVVVSTTKAPDRGLWERIRDVRIRKIQGKLAENGDGARFGQTFLDYYCRDAKRTLGEDVRAVRAIQVMHERRDDAGNVTRNEGTKTLVVRLCGDRRPPLVQAPSKLPRFMRPQPAVLGEDDAPGGDN